VEGRRAVRELLAAGRRPVRRLLLAEGLEPSAQLDEIEALAHQRKVRVEMVGRRRLDAEALTEAPQGVLAMAAPIDPVDLDALCAPATGDAFLVVVAGVSDPRNLGALLRSAECAGATGVVLARHRAAHLSPAAVKVAAGAVEHLSFSVVGGIPAALATLTELGVFTLGLAGEAPRSLFDASFGDGPVAVVVGGEEKGLAPLVRKRCDLVASIPQGGALPSLNVAAATAVACFEVARQRARAAPPR
jgi:23S rRNA (guanosine2251-2'-O)-methyltransferase